MATSWRPFASNFVNHAFENYIKRYDRSETAHSDQPKTKKPKFDMNDLFPYKNSQRAIEERMEKFQELQKHVQRQRVLIKDRDRRLERNRTHRQQLEYDQRNHHHNLKKQMFKHIRSFHREIPTSVTPKLIQRQSNRGVTSKSTIIERDSPSGGIFSLTSAADAKTNKSTLVTERPKMKVPLPELQKGESSSLPPINKLNSSYDISNSLRNKQDHLLKKLSAALPSYQQDFKKELDNIHNRASMTFEEHQLRNKIRRSHDNPYIRKF